MNGDDEKTMMDFADAPPQYINNTFPMRGPVAGLIVYCPGALQEVGITRDCKCHFCMFLRTAPDDEFNDNVYFGLTNCIYSCECNVCNLAENRDDLVLMSDEEWEDNFSQPRSPFVQAGRKQWHIDAYVMRVNAKMQLVDAKYLMFSTVQEEFPDLSSANMPNAHPYVYMQTMSSYQHAKIRTAYDLWLSVPSERTVQPLVAEETNVGASS
jgi:hypothetical protein